MGIHHINIPSYYITKKNKVKYMKDCFAKTNPQRALILLYSSLLGYCFMGRHVLDDYYFLFGQFVSHHFEHFLICFDQMRYSTRFYPV